MLDGHLHRTFVVVYWFSVLVLYIPYTGIYRYKNTSTALKHVDMPPGDGIERSLYTRIEGLRVEVVVTPEVHFRCTPSDLATIDPAQLIGAYR